MPALLFPNPPPILRDAEIRLDFMLEDIYRCLNATIEAKKDLGVDSWAVVMYEGLYSEETRIAWDLSKSEAKQLCTKFRKRLQIIATALQDIIEM